MSQVVELVQITKRLIAILQEQHDESKRDEIITEVQTLLSQRAQLITSLKKPFSEEEELLGKELIQLDQNMSAHLEKVKYQIQKDIQAIKVKKVKQSRYVNPYDSLRTDGVFVDKRN